MKKINTLLIAYSIVLLSACSKGTDPFPTPEPPVSSTPAVTYVVGYYNNSTTRVATLWKDGVKTDLSNGVNFAAAYDVFVLGNDVYVGGYQEIAGKKTEAVIWKNGVASILTDGTKYAHISAIFVSGSDVYAVGHEAINAFTTNLNIAKVWKNGVASNLTSGIYNAYASAIYVAGSDVYVVGSERNMTGTYTAKMWKNGIETSLPSIMPYSSSASDIYVSGTDVYIAWNQTTTAGATSEAKIWKNGIDVPIVNNAQSFASLFVTGTTVYTCGDRVRTSNTATLAVWKDGVASNITNGTFSAIINGSNTLFVLKNDIYIVGSRDVGVPVVTAVAPVLWKNGVESYLPVNGNDYGVATSVFVK